MFHVKHRAASSGRRNASVRAHCPPRPSSPRRTEVCHRGARESAAPRAGHTTPSLDCALSPSRADRTGRQSERTTHAGAGGEPDSTLRIPTSGRQRRMCLERRGQARATTRRRRPFHVKHLHSRDACQSRHTQDDVDRVTPHRARARTNRDHARQRHGPSTGTGVAPGARTNACNACARGLAAVSRETSTRAQGLFDSQERGHTWAPEDQRPIGTRLRLAVVT